MKRTHRNFKQFVHLVHQWFPPRGRRRVAGVEACFEAHPPEFQTIRSSCSSTVSARRAPESSRWAACFEAHPPEQCSPHDLRPVGRWNQIIQFRFRQIQYHSFPANPDTLRGMSVFGGGLPGWQCSSLPGQWWSG